MLNAEQVGNRKLFKVNQKHPLYDEIKSIVSKYFGLDVVIDQIVKKLGQLDAVYLTGDIAKGTDSGLIDLIFVGEIDQPFLIKLIQKAETLIHRKIRYLIYSQEEFEKQSEENQNQPLLIWQK